MKRQQSYMLSRLARKERRLMSKLRRKDSVAYARLSTEERSFDSLSKLAASPSITDTTKGSLQGSVNASPVIDSLKRVQGFLQSGSMGLAAGTSPEVAGYSSKLENLNKELAYRKQIEKWSAERMATLKSGVGSKASSAVSTRDMEKTVFYASSRIKAYREIAETSTKLEEKALEYLQGTDGFSQALSLPTTSPSVQGVAKGNLQQGVNGTISAADLEHMGFQTKQGLQRHLQQSFGGQLNGAQQQLSGKLKDYQQQIGSATSQAKKAKQDLQQLKGAERPSFRVNPMRGLPFLQRIEKGYNFQTSRPTNDLPALLDVGAYAGFRHTPRLSYGVGAAISSGLGQGWSNVRLSFEGIALCTYAKWGWLYGVSAYGEYETTYRTIDWSYNRVASEEEIATRRFLNTQGFLLGLQKTYRINHKFSGAVQVLYDLKWREKSLTSPIVIRLIQQTTN